MALRLKFYVNYSLFSYLRRHVLSNQFDPNSSQFDPSPMQHTFLLGHARFIAQLLYALLSHVACARVCNHARQLIQQTF